MGTESWQELYCNQCVAEEVDVAPQVFMRAKDLADHKLEVHGPTKDQLVWAVAALHTALYDILSDAYVATSIRMYDEYASTKHYGGSVAAVNHNIVQRVVRGG